MTGGDGGRRPPRHQRTRIRIAAYLIACDGAVTLADLRGLLAYHGYSDRTRRPARLTHGSAGSSLGRVIADAMRPLREMELVVREGEGYTVPDLGELADWLADELNPDDEDSDALPEGIITTGQVPEGDSGHETRRKATVPSQGYDYDTEGYGGT